MRIVPMPCPSVTTALVESALACTGTAPEAGEAEIVWYEGNRIEVQVRGGGGLLILSEVDYPGWRATVDGDPVRLVRADYVLRALCVPAGEHRVVLVYDPTPAKIGLAITGVALSAVVAVAVWETREKQRLGPATPCPSSGDVTSAAGARNGGER